ncbi:MAG: dihydrofolate reductase [Clostridia bacterium]|nr:dihydrofolate reductase [Clostridia bacterium]
MFLVVAVDKEWGIGYKGELLARVKADLSNFAKLTTGKTVVLGANTLATFPGGRVLKNRTNIVLSRRSEYAPDGAIMVRSIDELFEELKKYNSDDVAVIGGASVYKQLLPYCDTAYVTHFYESFEKDAYFLDLDSDEDWKCVSCSEDFYSNPETDFPAERMKYCFAKYERRSK